MSWRPLGGILVLSWVHLGLILGVLGPTWAHVGLMLGSCWAHVGLMLVSMLGSMLGSCWAMLGLCWDYVGASWDTWGSFGASCIDLCCGNCEFQKSSKSVIRITLLVGWSFQVGAMLGLCWVYVGAMLGYVGPCWAFLEPRWSQDRPS